MQDDKDDGAAWLVKEGIADPERLVIFGYSYGGFAAAAAVVRPNSPYQCAISGAPVTNLARLGNTWSENRLQRLLQGRTVKGMDPMQNVEKANIPVLLYVGDRDVRTPAFHARDFYNGVKDRVDARFELIPDMAHSLPWYPRHQQQTLQLMEDFLAAPCAASRPSARQNPENGRPRGRPFSLMQSHPGSSVRARRRRAPAMSHCPSIAFLRRGGRCEPARASTRRSNDPVRRHHAMRRRYVQRKAKPRSPS
jgi:hypothetical protein